MRSFFYSFSVLLVLAISIMFVVFAKASPPLKQTITLRESVVLSAEEQALIRSLPLLKVMAYQHAPPLSLYNRQTNEFQGISVDIFRFIAEQIDLPYEFVRSENTTFNENIQQFEQGHVDILIPASYLAEREQRACLLMRIIMVFIL